MLQLVFTVCSIVQGAMCHELAPIPLDENAGMMACAMAGQFEGAKYTLAHPNWWIARYKCKPANGLYTNL